MEDRKGHDTAYDWKNHVDLEPYIGGNSKPGIERAQEALAKAEALCNQMMKNDMEKLLYADTPVPSMISARTAMPGNITISLGHGKGSVTLQEDADGYFHAAASGCGLSEAAEVFFNEVIACHALALGKLRRERDELVAEVADWRAKDRHSREACVPQHLWPDAGVKGF